jgi:hypothetical protein
MAYIFVIFEFTIYKFLQLREDLLRTNSTGGFLEPLSGSSRQWIFSLYFIHLLENISVFQLISQINSKLQMFQHTFFLLKKLEVSGSGSNLRIQLFPPECKEKERVIGEKCGLKNELLSLKD